MTALEEVKKPLEGRDIATLTNVELVTEISRLLSENEELREKAALHSADAKTAWAECDELRKRLDIGPHGEDALDVAESAADHLLARAEAAEAEVERLKTIISAEGMSND
ncbi:hypothetical protein [Rhizobium rhizogenes]|uniref:hypothetical protein n=1 Tax=Rhizobium rhizogenes TaxID=359 RepID=UPI0022C1FD92|nr:hypothetical protein [Rhizobium rhizogenes]MCZ7488228.1 hypothetical protein [Rhizobium rhizogenes]